ncbi:MAG: hypothetical protein ACREV6_10995 [Clostridium sp.]|uniref:hypothetical protein n=1 Tax=Clostridium sp. TaxID=1506 RepID=UPI003D6D90BE
MRSSTEIDSIITKLKMRKGNPMRYTRELNMALDLIEEGNSFSKIEKITQLNKSMLAREIRKRKNIKAR